MATSAARSAARFAAGSNARLRAVPDAAATKPPARARVPKHLGPSPHEEAVTDFEQSLICAAEAFYRFVGLLLGPEGRKHNLAGQDNVILQQLVGANDARSVTELARFANRDDIANIQYSLRKLIQAGLVEKAPGSTNRDTRYQVTTRGQQLTDGFLEVRRDFLMRPSGEIRDLDVQLRNAAHAMSLITSLYDHATRKITARGT